MAIPILLCSLGDKHLILFKRVFTQERPIIMFLLRVWDWETCKFREGGLRESSWRQTLKRLVALDAELSSAVLSLGLRPTLQLEFLTLVIFLTPIKFSFCGWQPRSLTCPLRDGGLEAGRREGDPGLSMSAELKSEEMWVMSCWFCIHASACPLKLISNPVSVALHQHTRTDCISWGTRSIWGWRSYKLILWRFNQILFVLEYQTDKYYTFSIITWLI